MDDRIAALETTYTNLGNRYDEAAKAYRSMLQHPAIDAKFKSIANRSATFKKDLSAFATLRLDMDEKACRAEALRRLVELETEARAMTQQLDSLRRALCLSPIIDDQTAFINQRKDRGFAA